MTKIIVRELITRLGFQLNQGQLNKAEQATARIKDRANDAANAFRNIAVAFASFSTFKSLISIGDEMQSLRSRIGMLPQTIDDAGVAFDDIADRAIAARSSIQAYGQLYVRLAGATSEFIKSQEEVFLITDAISQALVIGGANAAEAASATLQLSQAFQKGKLDGDEFRSFMENLSSDFKNKLAKELGTTKDKLFEMSSSGELTTKKLAEAFKKMAPEISKQMMTIPLTVGQATTIVVSRFSRMIDRMNRESKFITRIANTILGAFDKIESGVDSLAKTLGGYDVILRIIGASLVVVFGAKAIMMIRAFGASAALALFEFTMIAIAVAAVAFALEDLYVWIQGGESIIGDAIGPWSKYSVAVMAVFEMIGDAISTTWDLLLAFGHIFTGAFTLDIEQLKYGWNNAAQILWNIISGALANIKKSIQDVLSLIGIDISGGWSLGKSGAGTGTAFAPPSQSAFAPQAGAGMVNNQTTNVSVTVPPGTPQEQVSFLDRAAKQSFSDMNKPLRAIDMGVHAQ